MDFGSIRPFARFVRQLEYLPDTVSPPSYPMDARLFFVSSGEGRIEAGERVITMPAGSILFLNAGVPYRLLPCSAVYIAVNFDFTWAHSELETPVPPLNLNTAAPKPPLERHTFPELPCFDTVCFYPEFHHAKVKLLQLALEYSKQLPLFRQEMSAILLSVLTDLARHAELRTPGTNRFDAEQIIQYIHRHYSETLDNRTLAAHFHFHPNYISAEFKRSIGKPLHRYVLETRIRSAISLMESGNSSISEIAMLTGFSDTNYFTRYFKQIIGTTPGKYIQSCIQK